MEQAQQVTVLIPSLEPDERLLPYVQALLNKGFAHVVVVDDGSGEGYQPIFRSLDALPGCTVLHHEKNLGKGTALKTGYAYIRDTYPQCVGVVTADSDGQHTVADVWRIAELVATGKRALYLGTRDFSLDHVPWRSRRGNRITAVVFWLLYGTKLQDTQTGLRGFPTSLLDFMIDVEGARFEYEMNVLIACARDPVPMIPETIETVYENNNKGTHFHSVKDGFRIYRVIFGNFFRFISSSLVATVVDFLVFLALQSMLSTLGLSDALRIAIATFGARVLSAAFNFLVNKNFVFNVRKGKEKLNRSALLRYALLVLCSTSISWLLVTGLHAGLHMSEGLAKALVDSILFFVNYRVQRRWVFAKERTEDM